MPQVIKDGGVYFDPENSDSITATVEDLISNTAQIAGRLKLGNT